MKLKDLKKIIPYKWKVQTIRKGNEPCCMCVAYIDARDVMDLLDEVCEPQNWSNDFKAVKNTMVGGIGIKCSAEWVWKWDAGDESNVEKKKGEVSDSLKRAGVEWGIGRFLYDLEIAEVPAKLWKEKYYPCDDKGSIMWGNKPLTEYINNKVKLEHSEKIWDYLMAKNNADKDLAIGELRDFTGCEKFSQVPFDKFNEMMITYKEEMEEFNRVTGGA